MTAEIPERKEIECPRDLSSAETGKQRSNREWLWLFSQGIHLR